MTRSDKEIKVFEKYFETCSFIVYCYHSTFHMQKSVIILLRELLENLPENGTVTDYMQQFQHSIQHFHIRQRRTIFRQAIRTHSIRNERRPPYFRTCVNQNVRILLWPFADWLMYRSRYVGAIARKIPFAVICAFKTWWIWSWPDAQLRHTDWWAFEFQWMFSRQLRTWCSYLPQTYVLWNYQNSRHSALGSENNTGNQTPVVTLCIWHPSDCTKKTTRIRSNCPILVSRESFARVRIACISSERLRNLEQKLNLLKFDGLSTGSICGIMLWKSFRHSSVV